MGKLSTFKGILAFTDGASSRNPGPSGWGVILIYPTGRVQELGGGSPYATNNQMEIQASIEALKAAQVDGLPIQILTDSKYVIDGATQWIAGWKRRDWQTVQQKEVLNRDLWEELDELLQDPKLKGRVDWRHLAGHAGIPGNERADQIAVSFSAGASPRLFSGSIEQYSISESELLNFQPRKSPPSKRSKQPARYYLSFVDGVLARHKTWAECEARVKGKAGVRYCKITADDDEASILKSWGAS